MKLQKKLLPVTSMWLIAWSLILVLALALRLPYFGSIPNGGLNRDEAALGYNAYSLLNSGHDEYGKSFPVTLMSFGDQKLPGYVYALIPFEQMFGLNPVVVRLPSLLAGLVSISVIGLLSLYLGKEFFGKQAVWLSIVSMLAIAVSPWGNHFSRTAYEAHLAMAFFVSGLLLYLLALDQQLKQQQHWLIIGTALLWSLTLFTYHAYHIFTPLFIFALLVLDWKRVQKADLPGLMTGTVIGIITVALLFFGGVWSANLQKSGDISPFHKESLQRQASIFRYWFPGETILDKMYANSLTEGTVRFAENLVQVPAGNFLFVHGTDHGDHNPGNTPNFHVLIAPFLILGILSLWDWRRKRSARLLMIWLLLSLIPSSLTITPQHTVRFSPGFPVIELLAAIGVLRLFLHIQTKRWRYIFVGILVYLLAMSVTRQMIEYLYVIPEQSSPNTGYHLLGKAIDRYASQGMTVVTQSPTSSPYIWYVFESMYDPDKLVSDIERYPIDDSGFIHVKRIGKVWFESIQWDDLDQRAQNEPLILMFKPTELPGDQRQNTNMQLLETLTNSKGETLYEIWQLGPISS